MNWLDAVVIVILAIPTILGFKRGLIKSVIPLVGVIVGIVLAGRFHGSVADWLSNWIESSSQAEIAGFAIIFVVVCLVAMLVARVISGFLHALFLGWVDRLGGVAFGLVLGGVIAGALVALMAKYPFWGLDETIQDSSLAAFLLDRFPFVLGLLPGDFEAVRRFFN
ncbi:CvpA family protein [Chloroflexota bacterium]